ncbi:hypothetical protein EV702DRAFT_1192966 [Suillus placidus]|uniref:Uncharacterized protein n=1 Tax=Suillus placidus TaxID=48579 RepID=A0A9P7D727_9AGAM|nr:hypothetical protein EV702DRAFT_1192966 [Suillus placidus]
MPPAKTGNGPENDPHISNSPTPGVGPDTRNTTRNPTSTANIELLTSTVMDTMSAESYLVTKMLCQKDQPYSLTHLLSILFHITQMTASIPLPVTTAIRAVAFILKKHIQLVERITAAIKPPLESIQNASEHLQNSIQQTGESLTSTTDKVAYPQPGATLFPPNTSNSDIMKKLKDALSNIHNNSTPPGSVKSVHALHNGGIIIELESESLALGYVTLLVELS